VPDNEREGSFSKKFLPQGDVKAEDAPRVLSREEPAKRQVGSSVEN